MILIEEEAPTLMKNLTKYINLIKKFNISIETLKSFSSVEEIDKFLIQFMETDVSQTMHKLRTIEDIRKEHIEHFTKEFKCIGLSLFL